MSDTLMTTAAGNIEQRFFTPPSLPKGGGTLTGSLGSLSVGGPDGGAGWQIPLPVSAAPARGLAPQLALNYSNSSGHGIFGMGWQVGIPAIRLRVQHGVPCYIGADRISGPDGSELLRAPGAARQESTLPFSDVTGGPWTVTLYRSRSAGLATRTERWEETGSTRIFWIDFGVDGSLSLYGWSDSARLADPVDTSRIAEWQIEETVSPRGEHILWRWRKENESGCTEEERRQHGIVTNVYPDSLYWMNKTSVLAFMLPQTDFSNDRWQASWLACLVFDYAERATTLEEVPPFNTITPWPVREDPLSFRRYGFEVRTRRLCHDVLLWHRTAMMADAASTDVTPQLITRLHLEYVSSPSLTQLVSAQLMAYEVDGTLVSTPPLEFALSAPPETLPTQRDWIPRPDMAPFTREYWQMADLQGDGIPGMLYQDEGAWWYRAPVRAKSGTDDITWAAPVVLENVPLGGNAQFADLGGSGKPELMLTLPGLRGTFTLLPDGHWGKFRPFSAFPPEFEHPAAQLADLSGRGLSDLVMIGPASVRLWPSAGMKGWQREQGIPYKKSGPLPRPGGDGLSMVALSDLTGSGLTDLVEITACGVTVWPSLGHGHFGLPIMMAGFSQTLLNIKDGCELAFNPERIYLADTDGSGVADILAVGQSGIHIFANQSGNYFSYKGLISPPEGVSPDNTWQLQVADLQGLGMGSLVLTIPHISPRSWVLNICPVRPWLLTIVVDNLGGRTELKYRSSAQNWLDEKDALQLDGKKAVSHLPFPVHTVSTVTQINELTGVALGSETRYLGGVWDGDEREFAGFRRLIQTDVNQYSQGNARFRLTELSSPVRTYTWFYSGLPALDSHPEGSNKEIDNGFTVSPPHFTFWKDNADIPETPEVESQRGKALYRALRGQVMRSEVYGEDGDDHADVPYSVSRQRLQVRAYDSADAQGNPTPDNPATLVTVLENLSFSCERIAADPQVTQRILLRQDAYGTPLESVSITYPRQLTPVQIAAEEYARVLYPKNLPAGTIKESADPQQYECWINLTRTRVHHLTGNNHFVVGLPQDVRTDVIWWGTTHPQGNPEGRESRAIPKGGFTMENLTLTSLLADPGSVSLTGYVKTWWRGDGGTEQNDIPTRQMLVACTETTMLDEKSLDVLRPAFSQTLGDLVNDCLKDKAGTINPQTLKRLRERGESFITPEIFFQAWTSYTAGLDAMLAQGYDDNAETQRLEAIGVLQSAGKDPASAVTLFETSLWYELKAAMGVHPNNGIPAEQLCQAVRWYAAEAAEDDKRALSALNGLKMMLFTRKHVPDLLFWRVLSEALAKEPGGHLSPELGALRNELNLPVQAESLEALLRRGGYSEITVPHQPLVREAWAATHNITRYHGRASFWASMSVRDSTLLPETQLTYSGDWLMVTGATDTFSFITKVTQTDWRFLTPVQIQDSNDNVSEATLDALGRVMHTRFYGTETPAGQNKAVMTGYSATKDKPFTPPESVEAALSLNATKGVPVHEAYTLVLNTWMPEMLDSAGRPVGALTGFLAWERQAAQLKRDGVVPPDIMNGRTPPYIIRIQTDRYDNDPEQQTRVQVTLHGGGQILQTAVLSPSDEAMARTQTGGVEIGTDDRALTKHTDVRWAISGKTEFDNKGNPVRIWPPFYLNDWRWVSNDFHPEEMYADTHVYDALNRETKVLTAAGYERWTQIFPWFTAKWDENDTLADVLAQRAQKHDMREA